MRMSVMGKEGREAWGTADIVGTRRPQRGYSLSEKYGTVGEF